jgi:hypothetical protein
MGKMKITPVDEVNWGLYIWQMPDGKVVMDEEGAYLSIQSMKGDIRQIKKLKDAAKHYGLDEGEPLFMAGHRPVSTDELEMQRQRMTMGLVPDEHDMPAMLEYVKEMRDMKLG